MMWELEPNRKNCYTWYLIAFMFFLNRFKCFFQGLILLYSSLQIKSRLQTQKSYGIIRSRIIAILLTLSFFLLTFLGFSPQLLAQPISDSSTIANLGNRNTSYDLSKYLEFLEDKDSSFTIAQISSPEFSDRFKRRDRSSLNFGYTNSTYWARLQLQNLSDREAEWILSLEYLQIDRIGIYRPAHQQKGDWTFKETGLLHNFASREIEDRLPAFNIIVPPQTAQSIYLRFYTTTPLIIDASLSSSDIFWQFRASTNLYKGFLYGILIFAVLYNLLLLVSIKDAVYLYFIIFVTGITLCFMVYDGFGVQFLWSNSIWWHKYASPILVTSTLISFLEWMSLFLGTKKYLPLGNLVLRWHQIIMMVLLFGIFFVPYRFISSSLTLVYLSCFILSFILGAIALQRGYSSTRYFLLAVLWMNVGFVTYFLSSHKLIPAYAWTQDSVRLGVVAFVVFLSLALADRINALKAEKLREQNRSLQAQEKLNQSLQQTQLQLIEAQRIARIGSWEFDVASGVSTWSEQQFHILGFDPNVPLPKSTNFFDIFPLDDPELRALVEETIANGNPFMVEQSITCTDRSIIHAIVRGETIRNERGQVVKLVGTITDISDRKRLELELIHSRDLRELIFNESNDALFMVDCKTLLIIDCNQYAIKLFEVDCKNDLIDIESNTLQKRQFTSQELAQIDQEISQKVFWSMEVEYISRKGREFWGDISVKRITFGEQSFNVVRIVDINARKQTELVLAKAKTTAEEASRAKSAFLVNMSHEIRTPMNGFMGMTQLLETTTLTEEQADFVKTIKESSAALLTIVNDIFDFSKIEAGMLEIEKWDFKIEDVVSGVSQLLNGQAIAKQIDLRYEIAPEIPIVIGDYTRLRQILINLVGNAIKFTPHGQVSVSVSGKPIAAQKEERGSDSTIAQEEQLEVRKKYKLKFAIADTGVGIQSDRIDELFQPFTQADDSIRRKYGGTGLGLAISKRLIELMNGTIWVESLGQIGGHPPAGWKPLLSTSGTRFYFEIVVLTSQPIDRPLQSSIKKPAIDEKFAEKFPLGILLVEDNIVNQMVASAILKRIGYQKVDIANNGLEALQALQGNTYDLILMDLQMPKMDGITATKIIRTELLYQVPIVALTANVMPEDRQACFDVGMNDYISKPIDIQKIMHVVSSLSKFSQKS